MSGENIENMTLDEGKQLRPNPIYETFHPRLYNEYINVNNNLTRDTYKDVCFYCNKKGHW